MPKVSSLFNSAEELITPIEGHVKGVLPSWLEGQILRVGPGKFDLDDNKFTVDHFFDGFAMVSKFDIRKNGKVYYIQRLLESEAYKKAMAVRKPVYAEFGTRAYPDPSKGFFQRMFSTLVPTDLTDNDVGSLYVIENEMVVGTETCFIHTVDTNSLDKKERLDYMKACGTMLMACHPLTDGEGNVWNFGASILSGLKYHLIKIPFVGSGKASDGLAKAKVMATIPSSWKTCMSYMHSFAMTENYIIFLEQPLLINCLKLAQIGIKGQAMKDTLEWYPELKNRFYVIEKETGNVMRTKFMTEQPFFVFHNINAYEKDEQIIVDLVAYPSPLVLEKMTLSKLRKNEYVPNDPSQAHRFVIPKVAYAMDVPENQDLVNHEGSIKVSATAKRSGECVILTPEPLSNEIGVEYPNVNPRYLGKPYRYFYVTGSFDQAGLKNAIAKVDLDTMEIKHYRTSSENAFCGEPLFVPKPEVNTDEDDGLIITTVNCSEDRGKDYLVILDAKTFEELVRVEFDMKFCQSLHSKFTSPLK